MLVRVNGSFILANFMVMDMEGDLGIQLILGRPFLRAARARIDVGSGEIRFHVRKRGHVLQVQAQGGAALPDMLGQ